MGRKIRNSCTMVLLGMVLTETVWAQDPSLVGWWKFDEGAGSTAQDSSGNAHQGTLQGAPQWVAGVFDGALAFSGSDYVQISYAADLALNEFTVSAWVNLATEPGVFGVHGTRVGGEYTFDFKVQAANIHGDIGNGSAWLNTTLDIAAGDTGTKGQGGDLELQTWYAIAYVIDNKNQQVRLYLDGDLKRTISISGTPLLMQSGESMRIGHTGYGTEGMNGLIDDVRIYSRALKTAEIKALVPPKVKARKPSPVNGATGVAMGFLQWTPGETAVFEDVYLGTTPELTAADRVAHQSAFLKMYFQLVPPLVPGQKYYWRVDAVDAAGTLIAMGDVWSFTMIPVNAWNPVPANSAKYQSVDVDLAWAAGQSAFKHEVFFSTVQDDVVNGAPSASKGIVIATTMELAPLTLETTYYWRVDGIDVMDNRKTGDVWSFTTTIPGLGFAKRELWTNSNAGTAIADIYADGRYPGSPTDVNDKMPNFESPADIANNYIGKLSAWLHVPVAGEYTFWVAADDQAQLFLGPDPDSAVVIASVTTWTSAQQWDKEGSQKSKPITLEAGRYYLMAHWKEGEGGDSGSAAWQGAGIPNRELIAGSYLMPFEALWAYGPRPRNGAVDTTQTPELKWTAGTKATAHQVYLSDDANAVADGTASRGQQALEETSFDPGPLEFGKTYYWRVDEINPAEADSPWKGTVWSFTTANFIVIDDFEDYVDDVEGRIFQTWIDGWGYTEPAPGNPGNGTGSTVGYTSPPFAERTVVHGGRQAMPFDYNNIIQPYYSETDRTWTVGQNLTLNGMDTLSLWVRGNPVAFADNGSVITMSASGDDIWNNADQFRFAFKRLNGDGSIIAKVNSMVRTDGWTKAGVMIRESLAAGSAHASTVITPDNGASFPWRALTDDTSTQVNQTGVKAPYWVKITRTGNTFKAEHSADGKTWSVIGADATQSQHDIVMPGSVYIGLALTSHNVNAVTTAEFSDIKTAGNVSGAWQVAEIGADHPGNDPAQLYVAIQDNAGKVVVVKHPDLNVVLTTVWTEWQIPLTQFAGANVKAVKKMFVGVGDRTAPQLDGAGKLYIDDIQVIKPAAATP